MALDNITILNGVFSLIFVIISFIVGIKMMLKYKVFKDRAFILVGLAWIGISEPWWSPSIGFLVALINGTGISLEAYLIIGYVLLPFFLTAWLIAITEFLDIKKGNIIVMIYIIISIIFEILIFYFMVTDISMLAVKLSPTDIDFGTLFQIYLIFNLTIFIITGFMFAIKSLRSNNPEVKLKGKFLFIAFITYLVGSAIEIIYTFPQNRLILVLSAILYYIGFILPEWIKKHFLK